MQNNKRYWLRGGAIVVVLYIIVSLILIPFGNDGSFIGFDYWSYPTLLVVFGISNFIYSITSIDFTDRSFMFLSEYTFIVYAVIIYFIAGSILGWLYGKIRNRKKIV